MKNIALIFGMLIGTVQLCLAQTLHFTDSTGTPIPWVQVVASGNDKGILLLADIEGEIPTTQLEDGMQLVASVIGFETDTLIFRSGLKSVILKSENYALGEFVVTAQYRPVRIEESVNQIRVIDQKEIAKRGAVSLEDVLKNELNFQMSRDNIFGTSTSMQGTDGNSVKIMIDGVPVVGRLDGQIDLSQINLNQIERIEIVEGPLAVNYGANALAGTINLITKNPGTNQTRASISGYTETTGHYNINADVTLGWQKQSLLISGGRNYFDGWTPGDDTFYHQRSHVADSTRAQDWNPREQYFANAKYRINFAKGYTEFGANYFDEEIINRGRPRGAYGEEAFDDIYNTLRYDFNGKLQYALSKTWRTHQLVAFNTYRRTKSTFVTDLTGVNSELSTNQSLTDTTSFETYLARGSFIAGFNPNIEAQIGYEMEVEVGDGKRIQDSHGEIGNYALFATANWKPLDRFTVKPGIRYTYNTRYNAPVMPSLYLMYDLRKSVQARVSYAQGFRAPGLKELALYFVDINHNIQGNPDLEAETSHNISASVQALVNEQRQIGWEISGYYNDITNLIGLAFKEGTEYTYVNIGERQTAGIRAQLDFQKDGFTVQPGFAYLGVSNNLDNPDADKFSFTPEAMLRVAYLWKKPALNFNVFYKYNGKRVQLIEDAEENVFETYTSAYSNLDMTLSRNFLNDALSVQLGVQNLLDIESIDRIGAGGAHSGTEGNYNIGTGRAYFLRVNYSFSKAK